MSRNGSSNQITKMRFGGPQIISVLLCLIIVLLLYFYWSAGSRLKSATHEIESLRTTIKVLKDSKERLTNRVTVLTEDLKNLHKQSNEIDSSARNIKLQLDEAQMKLQSAESKVEELKSTVESFQAQLDSKTGENEDLTDQNMEKETLIQECKNERDNIKTQFTGLSDQQEKLNLAYSELQSEQKKSSSLEHQLTQCMQQQRSDLQQQQQQQIPNFQQQQRSDLQQQTTFQQPTRFQQQQNGIGINNIPQQQQQQQQQQQSRPLRDQQPQFDTANNAANWEHRIIEDGKPHAVIDSNGDQHSEHNGDQHSEHNDDNDENDDMLLEEEKKVEDLLKDNGQPVKLEDDTGKHDVNEYGNYPVVGINGINRDNGNDDNGDDEGENGDNGDDEGENGDQGDDGNNGDNGDDGNNGDNGDDGNIGDDKYNGDNVDQGDNGDNGDNGDQDDNYDNNGAEKKNTGVKEEGNKMADNGDDYHLDQPDTIKQFQDVDINLRKEREVDDDAQANQINEVVQRLSQFGNIENNRNVKFDQINQFDRVNDMNAPHDRARQTDHRFVPQGVPDSRDRFNARTNLNPMRKRNEQL